MIRALVLFFPFYLFFSISYAQTATITEEILSIDTYSFDEPNPVPILTDNTKIYPYFKFESYEQTAKKKDWKVVTLENDYIKLSVLPEIGGKIWGAIEKKTGAEFLYKNEVIKFRNIAMRGPWTSGGVEFNFGIIGHSPATATPVDYIIRKNNDGSVSCIVGTMDLTSRTRWTVEINLQKDKAYFETKASWYNATPLNQSYYNWMTAAAAAKDDLEFFIPGNLYLEHGGEAQSWPIDDKGRDLSFYKNNNFGPHKSYHIVGDYKDFFGGYYHDSKFGFGHISAYEEMPGQKLWLWSQSRNGGIWEDLLTDTDGQYIEFQAGRLFNQYYPGEVNPISQATFAPFVMDRWEELWFPFKEIGGMVDASEFGVLNVEIEKGKLEVGVNALQELKEELRVLVNGKQIFDTQLNLVPMEVFSKTFNIKHTDEIEVIVGRKKLYYTSKPSETLFKRPFASDPGLKISKAQKLFTEGWEAMKYRAYDEALGKLTELIAFDSSHQEGLVKLAELEYRRTNYKVALKYANNVLQMDTYNTDANYFAGIIYRVQNDYISALESLGWAARDIKYRSVSYVQMAEIYFEGQEYRKAEKYALKALDFNTYNIAARQLLVVLARKQYDVAAFDHNLEALLRIDPLNHFAVTEHYFMRHNRENSGLLLKNVQNEFSEETVLELALQYENLGLIAEAIEILSVEKAHTKMKLWLAYLLKNSDPEKSNVFLKDALNDSVDFVFPYRRETISVLEWGLKKNRDWKLQYYLAQNYMAVGRNNEGLRIVELLGDVSNSASFYRFRVKILEEKTYGSKIKDYKKALKLSQGDWKILSEVIQFYDANKKYNEAYKLAAKAFKKFPKNYEVGLNYAQALLKVKKYSKSIAVLKELNVLPSELGQLSRRIYYDAHIFLAYEFIQKGNYKKATQILLQAKVWPENLGVGKPFGTDTRFEDFLLANCYRVLHEKSRSEELLNDIVERTNDKLEKPSVNHLFGLLSLKRLGKEEAVTKMMEKLKKAIQKGDIKNRQALVVAFYEKDTVKLSELKKENIVNEGFWNLMSSLVKE